LTWILGQWNNKKMDMRKLPRFTLNPSLCARLNSRGSNTAV
jgi:hypothetical protein